MTHDGDRVWRPSEIVARYRRGERAFTALEITGVSEDQFRGAVLDGADFTGAFIAADFTAASLRGCTFNANVKTCIFDGADLHGAAFRGAAICAATFVGARLVEASFEGAYAQGHTLGRHERPPTD